MLSGDESGSEYYSGSDGEGGGRRADEVEEEVWRSEWKAEFVQVGGEFFEGAEKVEKRERADDGGSRLQRRLRRLERERQQWRQQRRERLERQQRRLAAVEVMDGQEAHIAASPFNDAPASLHPTRSTPTPSPSPAAAAAAEMKAGDEATADVDLDDAMQIESLLLADDGFVRDLWLLIDKPVRAVLKRLTDYTVLHHVEQLLLAFKQHAHAHQQQQQLTAYAATPFAASSLSSAHFRVLPSMMADEVALLMPEPFLRYLTYALLAFHSMHSPPPRRGGKGHEDGVVIVRMQRGFIYHTCSLVHYCSHHFNHTR